MLTLTVAAARFPVARASLLGFVTSPESRCCIPPPYATSLCADDVIQLLAQLQADPARVNEGCAMIVGEAVGAYTRDAPPATLARFQAAMAAAMEADDDD